MVYMTDHGSISHHLDGKVAIVIGAGQTPGDTIGNGRATAIMLSRAGATVAVADQNTESAEETVAMIVAEGGTAIAARVDVTNDDDHARLVSTVVAAHDRIDILHNNVGVSIAGGDADALELDPDDFDRLWQINVKGMWMAARHAAPVMRSQGSGSIVNISSMAVRHAYPLVGYKTTKTAILGLTENLAATNAAYGIRVNSILPGLMNTPMAIENRVTDTTPRAEVIAGRDRRVPLGRKMGTAWDVANAALFLHSDEARFITGVHLHVDGGTNLL
jgi:NAD(P)-dependent dehydrogenase (short-subunit alcohol dehydrogenase family)